MTLAFLALASIILVAFVTSARFDSSASFSYSKSLMTEQLAQGALQLVVGQLQLEMAKDALPDTGGGAYATKPLYTNITSINLLPQPVGTNAAMPSLLKISTTNAPFTGSALNGTLIASPISSTTASLNGRSVALARWNSAYLGSFPTAASTPDWVLVTRSGATNGTGMTFGVSGSTLNNPATANPNYAVGRFAYAVYNVGGLIDITAAGYPPSLVGQLPLLKKTLAGADLSSLGINAGQLTAWRNPASGQSITVFTNAIATNATGLVYPGDTTFLSRQDLIQAAQAGVAGLTTNVLQNLTVFTREKNAPSWGPSTPTGSSIPYAAKAGTPGSTNRFLPSVRYAAAATVTNYAVDGTPYTYPVQAGDSLIQRRFPLDCLAWIGPNGPQNGGTATAIQARFGLHWGTGTTDDGRTIHLWQYVGPNGTAELGSIETLDKVVTESREPNFFELLQAGILSGSLAVNGGSLPMATSNLHLSAPTLQILRIGAAIIDQASTAATPTVIEYSQSGIAWQAVGVKSLPYLNTVEGIAGSTTTTPGATTSTFQLYLVFGVWNPTYPGTPIGATAPTPPSIRLRLQGSVGVYSATFSQTTTSQTAPLTYDLPSSTVIPLSTAAGHGVNAFADPGLLTAADATAAPGPGSSTGLAWVTTPALGVNSIAYLGYRLPDFLLNKTTTATTSIDKSIHFEFSQDLAHPFTVVLEFQNPAGDWVPYSYAMGMNDQLDTGLTGKKTIEQAVCSFLTTATAPFSLNTLPLLTGANSIGSALAYGVLSMTSDPRSLRFGQWQFDRSDSGPTGATGATTAGEDSRLWRTNMITEALYPQAYQSTGYGGINTSGAMGEMQNPPAIFGTFYFPALLARNNTANVLPTSSYLDNDGVQRIGDSGLYPSTQGSTAGNPFAGATSRPQDRPVVLNRPFNSVGEIGYAFRDDPWRSLDLFTSNSADAGLLDLFTTSRTTNAFTAGHIDLNSLNAAALAGVLTNTPANPISGIPLGEPVAIAGALTNFTAAAPLVNKADLVLRFGPTLTAGDFAGSDEQNVKTEREAFVRSLADVGQTRTWNLMIDLVAQAGHYGPTSSNLSQFVVEGERRYWLHVAIDRFTGEIVDSQLEPVNQ